MATLLEEQMKSVLADKRARAYNVPKSDRTYFELLTDPDAGELIKWDVLDSFRRTFIKAPPIKEQELRAVEPDDPSYFPPGTPPGGLQPGETIDAQGDISYDPALEATQRAKFTINVGSLVGGKTTAEGTFLPGPPRPGSPSFTFNLPPGMRPEEITADIWDHMLKVVRKEAPKEYQAAKEFDSVLKTAGVSAAREGILGIPALVDMPQLLARGTDYVLSPVGTNTLSQDLLQAGRSLFGLPDARPRPSSIYREDVPRIGQMLGLYATEYPNALYQGAVVIRPDAELMPIYHDFGKLLDEALANAGAPGALTPQQETEAQRTAKFLGGIMGGSLSVSGAFRAGAKLAVKGMKVEDLQNVTTLNRALYSLANSPGATFGWGGKSRRRFTIPGTMLFALKDQAIAGTAGMAMLATPDEWGPTGKIMAGIAAPFTLGAAKNALVALTRGQGLPLVGGFLEPFTTGGQQRLAARYWASIPGVKNNERLLINLLEDADNAPRRAGQDELVTTPDYFNQVSDKLRQAENDWISLRERGVSDVDALAQLSQSPVYGRYFTEVPVFGERTPSIEALKEAKTAVKLISDNLYGAMSWLATGSPIKNEVLRASGERLRVAEQVFKDLSRNFDADPGAASTYVNTALQRLDELSAEALATHATDALFYNRLRDLVKDPDILTQKRISDAERAVEGVNNAFRDMREIESALWTNIGANQIQISPENMALIGDKAAEIILGTPVAQRKQIPALLYQIAGRNRLLSDEALEAMSKAAGALPETPAAIRNARASLAGLRARRQELETVPYESKELGTARRKMAELEARRNDLSSANLSNARYATLEQQIASATERLRSLEAEVAPNPKLVKVDQDIAAQEAKLASLEDQIMPKTTAGDEAIEAGPNGILDSVTTLDEVLAARGALLDEGARARAMTGGANTARLANEAQKYIVDDWLQNPEIFGEVGTTAAYDVARKFSANLNDKYTRGTIADFLAVSKDRGPKLDPNQFLAKIIKDNEVGPNRLPTGSVDELDAALTQAKSPFLIRNDDGALVVDPNASLTRGLEDFTWESIRTGGPDSEKLSSQLIREEILNRLALVAFDNAGRMNPTIVDKSIRSWAIPIAKVEESYPGFKDELRALVTKGDELANRHKILNNPTKATIDEALATQNLDDLAGVQDAGRNSRKVQADRSAASVFLDNDPHVVARKLLEDPDRFETDVAATLKLLEGDETGAAKAGFQRALFEELTRRTLGAPETAGRMAGEAVLDPAQINALLTKNETSLRSIFSDFVGPPGSNMTTYDMIKIFNDEMSVAMAEYQGVAAGAKATKVELPLRGGEFIRNLGRISGVMAAKYTGGPALVMAGTGGRLANKIYERGGDTAIFSLVADAIADPSLAKLLMTETSRLDKKGKFIFDKRLTTAVRPYQFFAGPPTQAIRTGVEQQREIERIEREGGPTEIVYDPEDDFYRRGKIEEPQAAAQPIVPRTQRTAAPARPVVPASVMSQTSPVGAPLAAQVPASPSPDTMDLGRRLFGAVDPVFSLNRGGLLSAKSRKGRQLVG